MSNIPAAPKSTAWATLIYTIFFLSGAAALVYQVSWSRQIGLLFGHTVHAASVVLASYFAGMAVGYALGARWSSHVNPLKGYAIAELVVAGWACVIPLLLRWGESPTIIAWLSSSSVIWQMTARAIFSFFLLLPATIALGITLPMMAELVSRQSNRDLSNETISSRVSFAYACNTAGGMVGVLSATFFLLVSVGVRSSSYAAAIISTACAIGAWMLSRRQATGIRDQPGEVTSETISAPQETFRAVPSPKFWIGIAGLSGFVTLALEVLYTRMFSLVLHNSTYTFGSVVLVVLAALALGAFISSKLQRHFQLERLAGWVTGLGAMGVLVSVIVFTSLTKLEYYTFGESFLQYMGGVLLLVMLVVAPPITLLGILLPVAWTAATRDNDAGQVVGRLTAVNTIAAATGALAGSFLLFPWIGLWPSFVLVAIVVFIVPVALLIYNGRARLGGGAALGIAALAVLVLQSPVESEYGRKHLGERLVKRWNSTYGWIDVVQSEKTGSLRVRQNLHYRFGETKDNAREYRQAHIPLLLHSDPKDVLFLGLGTGLTTSGAIPHREVDRIVAVELIPEVVEAARLLAKHNFGVVDHPKVQIRIDDARHYLLATDRRFDVIVSDLFVPWESESGYLYTVEHYRVARKRLKPGGLFCQWLPMYQLGQRELELIANSFASVFPVTTLWWGEVGSSKPVIALVGTNDPVVLRADHLATRLAALRRLSGSSDDALRTPDSFYNAYQGDWLLRQGSLLNTDEHPRVEFLTPVSHRDQQMLQGARLRRYFEEVLAGLPTNAARLIGRRQKGENRDE